MDVVQNVNRVLKLMDAKSNGYRSDIPDSEVTRMNNDFKPLPRPSGLLIFKFFSSGHH